MNIHFNIADKGRKISSVILIIRHRGKTYRKATGITCEVARWSATKERTGIVDKDHRLKQMKCALELALDEFSSSGQIEDAIKQAIRGEDIVLSERYDRPTFWQSFDAWADADRKGMRYRQLARNNVALLMGRSDDWEKIDVAYYTRLVSAMKRKGWSVNYQGNMVKALKAVMHEGYLLGHHKNDAFREFHKIYESVDSVYLNEREMDLLWQYDGKDSMKCKARDLAWLGYLTCSRFSDYSRLTEDNISADGKLRFVSQKTSQTIVIPCAPKVREILSRNGGKAPSMNQTVFNRAIKNLCEEVGITELVEYKVSKGALHEKAVKRKCDLVSSHTFRRSAATNLYLSGVDVRSIQQLTGHTTIAMLEAYLKVGKEENARNLEGIAFFK